MLSLAYAVAEGGTPLGRATSLKRGRIDLSSVNACHAVAGHLVEDLAAGPITSVGQFASGSAASKLSASAAQGGSVHEGLATDLERIRDGGAAQIFRYSHGGHSFVLMAHAGGVEPLEAWAGAGKRSTYPLHKSVMSAKGLIPYAQAIAHARNLGSSVAANRAAALAAFSDAGDVAFGSNAQHMSYDRADLVSPDVASDRVRARIEKAARDAVGADEVIKAALRAPSTGSGGSSSGSSSSGSSSSGSSSSGSSSSTAAAPATSAASTTAASTTTAVPTTSAAATTAAAPATSAATSS